MILNQYDVLTKDGKHITVIATRYEVIDGEITLFNTHQGMHFDVFPKGYWERFFENGDEPHTQGIE